MLVRSIEMLLSERRDLNLRERLAVKRIGFYTRAA